MQKRYPKWRVAVLAGLIVLAAGVAVAGNSPDHGSGLSLVQGIVFGIVEGLTEYLPVSSTGHLLVAKEIMGLGESSQAEAAINAYIVVIQFGAIIAILVICLNRFISLYRGIFQGDAAGRKLLANLGFAFLPAVVVGLALEDLIKGRLFGTFPVIIGWVAGGLVILGFAFLCRRRAIDLHQGKDLEEKLEELVYRSLIILALLFVLLAIALRRVRLTAIVVASILLAIVICLSLFYFFGISVNFITISGLTVCFGMLLDNSILVLDAIHRRLSRVNDNGARSMWQSVRRALVNGTHEVAFPILTTTLTTVVAFLSFSFLFFFRRLSMPSSAAIPSPPTDREA